MLVEYWMKKNVITIDASDSMLDATKIMKEHGIRHLPVEVELRHRQQAGGGAGAADGESLSLEPAAVMATLMAGVTGSLPHVPTVTGGGTRVAPPTYAE